jgi:TolA-binding protein
MNNRLNNIFSETDCLSAEILIAYAGDRLKADEKYLVEKHLLDCALCADALEGISSLKDKSKLKPALDDISKRIDSYSQGRKPKIIYFNFKMRMAVAAVLIAMVGITFLFRDILIKQDKEMVAQRTVKESKIDKSDVKTGEKTKEKSLEEINGAETYKTDMPKQVFESDKGLAEIDGEGTVLEKVPYTAGKNEQQEIVIADEQKTFASFYRSGEDANTNTLPVATTSTTATGGTVVTKDVEMDQDESKMEDLAGDKTVVNEESETLSETDFLSQTETTTSSDNKNNAPEKNTKKDELKKEKSVTMAVAVSGNSQGYNTNQVFDQRYTDGVQLYQSADYSGCISQLVPYVNDIPDISAYYYLGVSQYFLAQYDSAVINLTNVTKDKNNSFYETAQWYLSLSYLGLNDKTEATKTLKDIVKAKGSFKVQAEDKLLEIEEK